MKREDLFVTAAIAASVALSSPVVNANGVNSPEARAWTAAQQSPEQLRSFIGRTRMIYALNYSDYSGAGNRAPESDITAEFTGYSAPASSEGAAPRDAQAPSAKRQKELDEFQEQLNRDMKYE